MPKTQYGEYMRLKQLAERPCSLYGSYGDANLTAGEGVGVQCQLVGV